jgi:ATP-dependent RNA helicase SUPV3L1/SUV3
MDYYAVAEKLLRDGRKAKAFEEYKKTSEYQIRLDNKAAELQSTFESKRNTRIISLVESKTVPASDEVIKLAVEAACHLLKTSKLYIEADVESFRKIDLNTMQHFDALDLLEKNNLIHLLYAKTAEAHYPQSVVEQIKESIKTIWINLYRELNVFKKHDKNFMDRNGETVSVEHALEQRYKSTKKEFETSVLHALSHDVLVECIFDNQRYAYLQESRTYRDALRQMMMEKIPADYTLFYPLARTMYRHFILHVGPTNSGKTYDAIADLMSANNGVYLAPLRLLALENQEKMNDNGVPCNLYTGEEQILVEGARHTSSTIETLSLNQKYDVAVIDEAQLISDDQRGWAWTRAILGVRANIVHVCMSSDAEKIVKKLIDMCGDSYEVVTHQRATPLVVDTAIFDFPRDVKQYDALIVFSRRSVWNVAAELERRKIKASVIYGALPPSVRREEVRKFVEGETSVVVATDAIGMGLNLPIKRIVFLETEKFDGKVRRPLIHSEYKQIAGRAGRLGIFDVGHVATTSERKSLNGHINRPYDDIENANILFPESLLTLDSPLIDILKLWKSILDVDVFQKADIEKEIMLCELLDKSNIKLSKQDLLSRIQIPFNHEDQDLLTLWLNLVTGEYEKRIDLRKYVLPKSNLSDNIQDLEGKYRSCDLIFSFSKTIGSNNDVLERIMDAKIEISDMIINKLKENKKNSGKKCKSCKKTLPFGFQYGYCEKCYNEMHRRKWWYDEDWH